MTVDIELGRVEIEQALRIARVRYDKWKDHQGARYRNTVGGHLVGSLGEVALERWMLNLDIPYRAYYLDTGARLPDFSVGEGGQIRVDVKSLQKRHRRPEWGYSVEKGQVDHNDVELYVFATVDIAPRRGRPIPTVAQFADSIDVVLDGCIGKEALLMAGVFKTPSKTNPNQISYVVQKQQLDPLIIMEAICQPLRR